MENELLSKKIRDLAESNGIDILGFTDASEFKGYAVKDSLRQSPELSLPEAEIIIVAGIYIGGVTLPSWTNQMFGRTSRLYLSEFFLDIVKPMEPIADLLKNEGYKAIISNSETNEGSVLPLKLAAIRAGLGWQGKNSLLISKKYGTFLALGGIITNAELEYTTREEQNLCGKCNKCQKACPLNALDQSHVLNINKCLSFHLQNENLPQNAKVIMGNRVGDCEICQDICPWNKKHLDNPIETKLTLQFRSEIDKWEKFFYLPNLVKLTEKEYQDKLGILGTGISYEIFHRNVLLALEGIQ